MATVSSEQLAELAGVNAAKVRKDLSYLGSYGTRGVGYDVAELVDEIARELGLTHDWPVAIVGLGNLGHALANYRGFGARGFRIVALVDADAAKLGEPVGELAIESIDDLDRIVDERDVAIGVIATPAAAAQEVADRLVAAGVCSILNFAPAVAERPEHGVAAQGRPRDRAADPLLLPTAPACSTDRKRVRVTWRRQSGRPRRVPGQPPRRRAAVRRRRRRADRGAQDRGAARRRARWCTSIAIDVSRRDRARGARPDA